MATNIKLKKSSVVGKAPLVGDLDYGELAINYADGKLFYKNSSNQIQSFIDSALVQNLVDGIDFLDSAEAISVITGSDLDMGTNKILYSNVYATEGDLPNASNYHGMFAHVHATGAAYFAHAGSWVQLANNSDLSAYGDADVISLVDSAYVQARQLQAAAADGIDSAAVINLIDSAYVQARQTLSGGGSGTVDSAAVINLIDSAYVNSRITQQPQNGVSDVDQYNITADSGQTVFGGVSYVSDDNIQVFLNGILLKPIEDYTASNNNTITLTDGADSGDEFRLISFSTYSQRVSVDDYSYTATAGQTVFSGSDDNGSNLYYTPGNLQVHLNGLLLTNTQDYIAANGSSVTLISGADSGDAVVITSISGDSAYTNQLLESFIEKSTFGRVAANENLFVADSGQDSFGISYTPGAVQVYLNGILLSNSLDYIATNGTSINLTSGVSAGDNVIVTTLGGDSALFTEAQFSPIIDSAYVQARQISYDQNLNTTDSVTFAGLTINGIVYPIADGSPNQAIITDGSGNLSFDDLGVQAVYVNVKNVSGGPLQKGLPVHQTGTVGNGTLEVVAARADTPALMPAGAILNDSLNAEEEGQAIITGKISGVNTSLFSEGDVVFVGATGGYTNVKPAGENIVVQNLGVVTRVDATNGGGIIQGAGRGAATPNLNSGNIFIGNDSNYSSIATLTTDIVPEGSNLYYTTARHDSDAGVYLTNNLYATQTYVTTAIDNLIDGAPGTLNTLNEIAAALNDDDSAYATLVTLIGTKTDFDSADATALITSYGYSTYDSTNTLGLVDSTYVQSRQTSQDFAYSSLTGAPNVLDSTNVSNIVTAFGYSTYDSVNAAGQIEAYGYLTDAIDSARITSMLAADSFSIGGTVIGDGKIEVFTSSGSPSYIDLYCEVGNLHRTRIQSDVHANYSGQVTLTAPTTSGTLALTSNIVDSAAIITLIQANDQQRDSAFVTGIIDSAYIQARQIVGGSGGTDSATVISLITSTVDSAYVALREANAGGGGYSDANVDTHLNTSTATSGQILSWNGSDYAWVADQLGSGGSGGGLDSAAVLAIHEANSTVYNSVSSYQYTADSAQTVFGGVDDLGNTLSYFSNQLQVFVNGILLLDSSDYTALTGTSITLTQPAEIDDRITISSYRGGTNATIKTSVVSYEFIGNLGQTIFSGNDRDSNLLSYDVNSSVLVFLNGTLMVDTNDYAATSGSSIVFTEGVDSGDNINIIKMTSSGLVTVDGLIDSSHVSQITNQTISTTVDSAYINARVNVETGTDSAATIALITGTVDSAYVSARVGEVGGGTDSATVLSLVSGLVDSDYVQARQSGAGGVEFITYTYSADSGQTAFTGIDFKGNSLSYQVDKLQVFLNGLLLADSDDYVATNGNSITLNDPAAAEDLINIISYETRSLVLPTLNMSQFEYEADSGDTIFTGADDYGNGLSYTRDNLLVHLNGILLKDSADYTATDGSSIILTSGADSADLITITTFSAGAVTNDLWRQAVSNIEAESNKKYIVDCSSSAITLTLPSSPSFGDEIKVIDGVGNAETNNITINRNGNKILGADSDFTVDVNRTAVDLVYYNATQGWIISGTS